LGIVWLVKLKTMKAKIWMLCFMLYLCSCEKILKNEEFSIKCVPYLGSELRIDGYYYLKRLGSDGNKRFISYFIFYSDGVSSTGNIETENLSDVESYFATWSYDKWIRSNLYVWGPFSIQGDKLRMQYYEPSDYLIKRIEEVSCTILNDSTFYLEKIYLVHAEKEGRSFTTGEYRFKQYSPKPDSTNNFLP